MKKGKNGLQISKLCEAKSPAATAQGCQKSEETSQGAIHIGSILHCLGD